MIRQFLTSPGCIFVVAMLLLALAAWIVERPSKPKHRITGVIHIWGDYWACCACGWQTVGFSSEANARTALDNHIAEPWREQ
jgi:hypothetical protein